MLTLTETHEPQLRISDFRNIDVRSVVSVNHPVAPGFRRVCDTVLTQIGSALHGQTSTRTVQYPEPTSRDKRLVSLSHSLSKNTGEIPRFRGCSERTSVANQPPE